MIALTTFSYVWLAFLCVGSCAFVAYLVYIYKKSRSGIRVAEAFFRFSKKDIENKYKKIKESLTELEYKASEWNFEKEFAKLLKFNESSLSIGNKTDKSTSFEDASISFNATGTR